MSTTLAPPDVPSHPRPEKKQTSIWEPRPAAEHITFTSSVLSTFIAGHGTYLPSKFVLRALADVLVMEVRLYLDVPIKVHLVLPNSITTTGHERENKTKPQTTLQLEGADKPRTRTSSPACPSLASRRVSTLSRCRFWAS
ncbi:hypothetical protein F4818DRAFT_437338 [Hypoxylon cercidicola]|nr:hypothetical protein F4818DRAFT_437338 [Hypoxylon cercidicola]